MLLPQSEEIIKTRERRCKRSDSIREIKAWWGCDVNGASVGGGQVMVLVSVGVIDGRSERITQSKGDAVILRLRKKTKPMGTRLCGA